MIHLFRSFDSPVADESVRLIGAFGKMPMSDEWLEAQVYDSEVTQFTRVVREAFEELDKLKTDRATHGPHWTFAVRGGDNRLWGGVLAASQGRSETVSPFIVFQLIRDKELAKQWGAIPVLLQEFYEKSRELVALDWRAQSVPNLLLSINSLPKAPFNVPREKILQTQVDLLEQIDFRDYWEGIQLRDNDQARAKLLTVLAAQLNKVSHIGSARTVSGLRIPLPANDELPTFVIFFMELISSCYVSTKDQLHVFWHDAKQGSDPEMVLISGPIRTIHIASLLDRESQSGVVVDIRDELSKYEEPHKMALALVRDSRSLLESLFALRNFVDQVRQI